MECPGPALELVLVLVLEQHFGRRGVPTLAVKCHLEERVGSGRLDFLSITARLARYGAIMIFCIDEEWLVTIQR